MFNCYENIYPVCYLKLRFACLYVMVVPFVPHPDLVLDPLFVYPILTYVGSDKRAIKFATDLFFTLLDLD